MSRFDASSPRLVRLGIALAVILIHAGVLFALVRGLAPDFTAGVVRSVTTAFTIPAELPEAEPKPPQPESTPAPQPEPAPPEEEGAAAPAGKQATPKQVAAPKPAIVLAEVPAPVVKGEGAAVTSGARDRGDGTGAGGEGAGTGAGRSGQGQGGGGIASEAVKIAGDINSARDYPREGRDLRVGDHAIVALTVGTDGRVKNCRVLRPSRDPQAGPVTCRLATERFRFRPAQDAAGNPVESVFGWKQHWFYPGQDQG